MRRKLIGAVLAAAMLGTMLAGCGNDSKPAATSAGTEAQAEKETKTPETKAAETEAAEKESPEETEAVSAELAMDGGVTVTENPDSATGYTVSFSYKNQYATNVQLKGSFEFYRKIIGYLKKALF